MAQVCPSCGVKAPDEFRFCGFCGTPFRSVSILQPEKQGIDVARSVRRAVTVLFADLTNSTRVAEGRDPEKVFGILQRILEKLSAPVKNYGGKIDKYTGDGFLATFGIPEAHEDDSYRAILAALEMQQIMEELSQQVQSEIGWDVRLRIGMSAGEVVSGKLDTGQGVDISVYGHVVNLGKRLQSVARQGTVVVSETIHRHTHAHFKYHPPVSLSLKGIEEQVVGYELIGRREDLRPMRGLSGRRAPNVGRAYEYEKVQLAVQRMQLEGQGFVAYISGEAGVGKSRLVEEVIDPLDEQISVLKGKGTSYDQASYSALIQILEDLTGLRATDSLEERKVAFDLFLENSGSLGMEFDDVLADLLVGTQKFITRIGDPKTYQIRIFSAVRRLLIWLARRQPVLIVIDDIQWVDHSSLEVMDHFSDLILEVPLALICVSRPLSDEEFPEIIREIKKDHPSRFIDLLLKPLTPPDCEKLVGHILPELDISADIQKTIFQRSSGNPLLIEELIRMVLDVATVHDEKVQFFERDWQKVFQSVPETVAGLMIARYDRQPQNLKKLLDHASVLGHRFSLFWLGAMLGIEAEDLGPALETLVQQDFLRRVAGGKSAQYSFRHILMQETIYSTILLQDRKDLHLKASVAIQSTEGEYFAESVGRIGYHLEVAESPDAAIYLNQAAEKAAERFANLEAVDYYNRARKILSHVEGHTQDEVDIHLGLGILYVRMGRTDEARDALETAMSLSKQLIGSNYRLGEIMYQIGRLNSDIGNFDDSVSNLLDAEKLLAGSFTKNLTITIADIECEIGWVKCFQGKREEGKRHALRALDIANENRDLIGAGAAHNLLAAANYWTGQFEESVKHAGEALSIRETVGDILGAASSQNSLGTLYHKLGQWSKAESLLRQAIYVQQQIGDEHSLPITWGNLGLLMMDSGRMEEAIYSLNQAIQALPKDDKISASAITCYLNRGVVHLRMGEIGLAKEDFDLVKQGAKTAKNSEYQMLAWIYKSEAELEDRNIELAKVLIQPAEALMEEPIGTEARAEFFRVKARLLEAENKREAAISVTKDSSALSEEIGNVYEVAHRKLELANLFAKLEEPKRKQLETAKRYSSEALETLRMLTNRADILLAENLIYRIDNVLESRDPSKAAVFRTLAHLSLDWGRRPEEDDVQEEMVSYYLQLGDALKGIADRYFARYLPVENGFVFMFSTLDTSPTIGFLSNTIQCVREAIDEVLRFNNDHEKVLEEEVVAKAGIASGMSQEAVEEQSAFSLFASASRLGYIAKAASQHAPPFQIMVDEGARNSLREKFEFIEKGEVETSGLAVNLHLLSRPRFDADTKIFLPDSTDKMVGRDRELQNLKDWIDYTGEGKIGGVCYLEAEAGMGKSRLLEDVLAYTNENQRYFHGKCESFRRNVSYWAWINLINGVEGEEPEKLSNLKSMLEVSAPNEKDEMLLQNQSADTIRMELFGRFREFLMHYLAEGPVLLVIEDVHWLDMSSLDVLDFLLPLTQETHFSMLFVARSEMPGPHRALVSKAERVCQDRFLEVAFSELVESEQTELLRSLLHTDQLPVDLVKLIRPFSRHPLYIEEAVRFLVEKHYLIPDGEGWQLQDDIETLPLDFRDLLFNRLDLLDNETLHVLQAAAVLGETFDRKVLRWIVPDETLMVRLVELEDRRWLIPDMRDNPLGYRFRHTLVRETIYSTLFRSKKQLLHQRAGEALEQLYPGDNDRNAEIVAYHFSQSGLQEKTLQYLLRAAEKSARHSALAESLGYYQQAVDVFEAGYHAHPSLVSKLLLGMADVQLSQGNPKAAVDHLENLVDGRYFEPNIALRLTCRRRLGDARRRLGEHDAALRQYQDALALFQNLNTQETPLGYVLESEKGEKQLTHLGIAQTYFNMRQNTKAREHAILVHNAAKLGDNPEYIAEANNLLAGVAFRKGDMETANALLSECIAIYQRSGNRVGIGASYSNIGILASARQDIEAALDNYMLSLAINENLGNINGITIIRNNVGLLRMKHCRFDDALEHFFAGLRVARQANLLQLVTQILSHIGHIHTLTGNLDSALEALWEAEALSISYEYKNLLTEVYWRMAESFLEKDDSDEALKIGMRALDIANEIDSRDLRSEAERVLARSYRRQGKIEAAYNLSDKAWETRKNDRDPVIRGRFSGEHMLVLDGLGLKMRDYDHTDIKHADLLKLPEPPKVLAEFEAFLRQYPDQ